MANLWSLLRGKDEARYTIDDWAKDKAWAFNGASYPYIGGPPLSSNSEEVENSFGGYVQAAYKADGIVFACILARQLVFSEARFQWQRQRDGQPAGLFGTPDLAVLERPWPNGTTGELLARLEQDTSLSGNAYVVREKTRLRRLRPDWVSIVLTAPPDEAVASDVAGYMYRPGGYMSKTEPEFYLPEQVAHWSPIPDPEAQYRGMSWLTPVVREIQGDKAATEHKLAFFDNGATLSTIVTFPETVTVDQFKGFKKAMDESHQGVANAYKTLYVGGGADPKVVGADMKQLDFKATQGAGETRIAAAARVPAVILGISEGLAGSSLNAGNYSTARRSFADGFLRPQWRSVCAALEPLVKAPDSSSRLWYDDRHIAFLRDDEKDLAEIRQADSTTLRTLADAGAEWDAAVEFVKTGDVAVLKGKHSGLFSVQLQPPGTKTTPDAKSDDDKDG